ncbi:Holliday junction branch migration protein RuvA [Mycoplasmopsis ciconiae]|uniref:Holliday junction branch migration protein RuvA n=1 Tax=Mycoplasmopsis ciconiae TaxID=561067 RepID=A0ABU7MLT5_9BACT|nr:Holliday junction branch migration protein RuvA [Mycoplasmopsis ciconiae]
MFESKGEGFQYWVADHSRFEKNQKIKLYIYELKNEYIVQSYAFKDFLERVLFIDLISTTGVGPKSAINIMNLGWQKVVKAIVEDNYSFISKVSYLNEKLARIIIANLKNKWTKILTKKSDDNIVDEKIPEEESPYLDFENNIDDLINLLKNMGFKEKQINMALTQVNKKANFDDMINECINIISKTHYEKGLQTQ